MYTILYFNFIHVSVDSNHNIVSKHIFSLHIQFLIILFAW